MILISFDITEFSINFNFKMITVRKENTHQMILSLFSLLQGSHNS